MQPMSSAPETIAQAAARLVVDDGLEYGPAKRKAARDLARRIIRHSPGAIGGVITAVTRGLNMAIAEGLQVESEQFASLVGSHDLDEGLAAWIKRRQPAYHGK